MQILGLFSGKRTTLPFKDQRPAGVEGPGYAGHVLGQDQHTLDFLFHRQDKNASIYPPMTLCDIKL